MRKTIVLTVLALLLVAGIAIAATTDFVANGDITVSAVTFGSSIADLFIANGSKSATWSFSGGTFTVTDPDATAGFQVGSSNSDVNTIKVTKSDGTGSACAENGNPGTSVVTLSTTADTYTITPSALNVCTDHCASVAGAATYNSYPTCGAATCNSGYRLNGSGATATCLVTGGGGVSGGGGGGVVTLGLATPTPTPTPTPSATPTPTTSPAASATTPAASSAVTLIRYANDPKVYMVENNQKRWVKTLDDFNKLGYKWSDVKITTQTYTTGSDKTYTATTPAASSAVTLIRYANDPKVYMVENNQKRWVKTLDDFNKLGYKWSDVKITTQTYTTGSDKTYATATATATATAATTAAGKTTFTQTLKRGSKGAEVLALQQKLKDLGYFPANVDMVDNFGPTTQKAVMAFQKAKGLSQVGIVGPATRALLNK